MTIFCKWLAGKAKKHFSIKPGGELYIERYYMGKPFGLGVFLHEYLDPDGDRQLHNHPWRWSIGIPLVGGYKEERLIHICPILGVQFVLRNIWWLRPNYIRGFDFHRIASVKPGTWTLFIHGKRLGGWAFLHEDDGVIQHYVTIEGQKLVDRTIRMEDSLPRIWFEQHEKGVIEYTKGKLERADWTADEDIKWGNKVFGKKDERG